MFDQNIENSFLTIESIFLRVFFFQTFGIQNESNKRNSSRRATTEDHEVATHCSSRRRVCTNRVVKKKHRFAACVRLVKHKRNIRFNYRTKVETGQRRRESARALVFISRIKFSRVKKKIIINAPTSSIELFTSGNFIYELRDYSTRKSSVLLARPRSFLLPVKTQSTRSRVFLLLESRESQQTLCVALFSRRMFHRHTCVLRYYAVVTYCIIEFRFENRIKRQKRTRVYWCTLARNA